MTGALWSLRGSLTPVRSGNAEVYHARAAGRGGLRCGLLGLEQEMLAGCAQNHCGTRSRVPVDVEVVALTGWADDEFSGVLVASAQGFSIAARRALLGARYGLALMMV